MAKAKEATKEGVKKSDEIRKLLKANPTMPVKEMQETLAKQGLKVTGSLIYYIKGKMEGKKAPAAKPKQKANGAAGKPEASKSQEIRKLLEANPSMSAGEVQAILAKQGVSVTGGLIYFVKGKMKGTKQRKGAKAKAAAKAGPVRKAAGSEVNKSHEVRELLAQNPHMPAKEIQEALAKRGIEVSGNLIYLLKSKAKATKRRQKREQVVKVATTNGHADPVATIKKVKSLASEVGGMGKLKSLIEALVE